MIDDHELNVASQLVAAKQLIEKRDRQLALASENNSDLLSRLLSRSDAEQLKTAKEALDNIAFQLGFRSFDNEKVEIAIESLLAAKASNEAKVEECDREIADLNLALECVKKNNLSRKTQLEERDRAISNYKLELEDRDRNIAILEDNLNRARSEHLEQLNAISQYLEQFGSFPNVTEKALGAIYLLTKVVYANIEKLDPRL